MGDTRERSQPYRIFTTPRAVAGVKGATDGDDLRARLRSFAGFAARYREGRLLGEGGMGRVVLHHDALIGRDVAIKILSPAVHADEGLRLRFLREATVQGQLEHPAIIPVYELGVDPTGALYFTMKRIHGVTLEAILEGRRYDRPGFRAKYSRRRLLSALASVCLAVDLAHRRGIIHRDLKPGNIMLGDYGEVYVLDWGVAKIAQGSAGGVDEPFPLATLPGTLLGTPGYMAPEQIAGADGVSAAADLYSLGAILFEILAEQRLHDHTVASRLIRSTLDGADARPSRRVPGAELSPHLEELCVKATALDPSERLGSARALHDGIERYLDGERDQERRRELAREHIARANEARAPGGGGDALEGRRLAIRELGQALALDPGNEDAVDALLGLLAAPPRAVPPEVARSLARSRDRHWRTVARFAGFVYVSMFLYAPFFAWAGVRRIEPLILFYMFCSLAAALAFWVSRQERPSVGLIAAVLLVSNLGFAALAGLFGPLFATPAFIAVNTGAFALLFGRRLRAWLFVGGALAILIPLALELLGLVSASYSFGGGELTVRSRLVQLEQGPTLAFLALTSLATLATAVWIFGELREGVLRAEERLLLYGWQLRQMVPPARQRRRRDTGREADG
ncbi:MAG: protein kinase [Nannocystis sp.]|nr:protein kinase [Nannocystis sp.]